VSAALSGGGLDVFPEAQGLALGCFISALDAPELNLLWRMLNQVETRLRILHRPTSFQANKIRHPASTALSFVKTDPGSE
jgi:hypothetical protein